MTFQTCDARHVNIVVRHQQFFFVEGDAPQTHVKLHPMHEKLLELDDVAGPDNEEPTYFDVKSQLSQVEDDGYTNDVRHYNQTTTEADNNINLENNLNYHDRVDDEDFNEDLSTENSEDDINLNDNEIDLSAEREDLSKRDDNSPIYRDSVKYIDAESNTQHTFQPILKKRLQFRNRSRKKRSAREQWRNSLPGANPQDTVSSQNEEPDVWQAVSDDDLRKTNLMQYKHILKYVGMTLLSVVGFVFIGACFIRDPIACIFAFGTGCPCCIICCPCIRSFTDKYLNVKRLVRDSMNRYMPGVIVKDDGTLDYYEPTTEELEIMMEIMEEIMD
ncbi:hypothetical protein DPMN_085437 [Dreissena polymorpha]|uniref:Uncharacterized protein n=1 Tax=Dreissena polymorpha TaxID=45954 RepID=A0A9D3YCS0_DREPO|nr:hypothetical protein DPMN_085437 [Dreissena polymorpha]